MSTLHIQGDPNLQVNDPLRFLNLDWTKPRMIKTAQASGRVDLADVMHGNPLFGLGSRNLAMLSARRTFSSSARARQLSAILRREPQDVVITLGLEIFLIESIGGDYAHDTQVCAHRSVVQRRVV